MPLPKNRFLTLVLVLGLLSALGPFAIDMYLPGLPSIATAFHASDPTVQVTLMVYLLAAGVGQLFFGPWSDQIGRKKPLYAGLVVFALGSAGCALASSITALIAFRTLQGIGACAGMVLPRAVVRDLYTGPDAVRLMALLMLIFAISPILAPLLGSFVVAGFGWRAVFWIIGVAALLAIILTSVFLTETRTLNDRISSSASRAFKDYARLLKDPYFAGLTAVYGFSMAAFMVFLANSSFVLINHYGLSSRQYSVAYSLNAVAFVGAAQMNVRLLRRFTKVAVVRLSAVGFFVAAATLTLFVYRSIDALPLLLGLLFVAFVFMGFILPNVVVLTLAKHGAIAGTASALMGTLQMLTGTAMVGIVSLFATADPLPMVSGIALCAACTLCATLVAVRHTPGTVPGRLVKESTS